MVVFEIIAAIANELIKRTMQKKESISLRQYFKSLRASK